MLNVSSIDRMSKADFDKYWLDKDGTVFGKLGAGRTGAIFERCRGIVQAFVANPGNRDLLATCREGLLVKAVTAVAEGEVLTRDLWKSLHGYGPEYPSSMESSKSA